MLRDKKFALNHQFMSARVFCNANLSSAWFGQVTIALVSSAERKIFSLSLANKGKSFTHTKNNRGPSIEPCMIIVHSEEVSSQAELLFINTF